MVPESSFLVWNPCFSSLFDYVFTKSVFWVWPHVKGHDDLTSTLSDIIWPHVCKLFDYTWENMLERQNALLVTIKPRSSQCILGPSHLNSICFLVTYHPLNLTCYQRQVPLFDLHTFPHDLIMCLVILFRGMFWPAGFPSLYINVFNYSVFESCHMWGACWVIDTDG